MGLAYQPNLIIGWVPEKKLSCPFEWAAAT